MPDAYLYSRVSTKVQLSGLGIDRQDTALTKFLATRPDFILRGTFRDLGISAFRGDNKLKGEFAEFLKLVRSGQIEAGSCLVVESLDRISREGIYSSLPTFLELMGAGIAVATVMDNRVYKKTADSGRDMMDIMMSCMVMARASEESETKSSRLKSAWAKKRERATATGELMTRNVPAWLTTNADGAAIEDPANSATLQRIFEWCANGHGYAGIVQRLNEARLPSFGRSDEWSTTYVSNVLRNRAAIGEGRLSYCNYETNRKQQAIGEPIQGYYPTVVSSELWARAQAAMALRHIASPGIKVNGRKVTNLFGGLCRCIECGGPMTMLPHSKNRDLHYLRCHNRYVVRTCEHGGNYPYAPLETAVIDRVLDYLVDDTEVADSSDTALAEAVAQTTEELRQAEKRQDRLYDLYSDDDDPDPSLKRRIDEGRANIAAIKVRLASQQQAQTKARVLRPAKLGVDVAKEWWQQAQAGDQDARAKLSAALRTFIARIGFARDGMAVVKIVGGEIHYGIQRGAEAWCVLRPGNVVRRLASITPESVRKLISQMDALTGASDRKRRTH